MREGRATRNLRTTSVEVLSGTDWSTWAVAGQVSGRRSIAKKLELDERYVGRVLEFGFLAPDIVDAILAGRQPSNLTFKILTQRLQLSWLEKRKQFGFPAHFATGSTKESRTEL